MMEVEKYPTKLFEDSKPGATEYIIISGQTSRLCTRFNPPMVFEPSHSGYEIALYRLETTYSFQNIDERNNTIRVSIDGGLTWFDLKIPVGCYDITGINEALQRLLGEKKKSANDKRKIETYIELTGNRNTFKCVLEIMSASTIIDFNVQNSVRSVLGFEAKKYVGGNRYEGENKVNILRVNSILVHCDVISGSRVNGTLAPVIYNFFPNVSPADKIVTQPQHLMYVPLSLSTIPSMTAWITDQEGKTLDLSGERLTLTFHIRKRR